MTQMYGLINPFVCFVLTSAALGLICRTVPKWAVLGIFGSERTKLFIRHSPDRWRHWRNFQPAARNNTIKGASRMHVHKCRPALMHARSCVPALTLANACVRLIISHSCTHVQNWERNAWLVSCYHTINLVSSQ